MSDGPHRSLPMSRKWKKAAEFADNSAADLNDVSRVAASAIHQDWKFEVSTGLMQEIHDLLNKPSLFMDGQFESLRRTAAGRPFANYLLDCLNLEVNSGLSGHEALLKAITSSIIDRSARAIRQIQEHYIRNSNYERSKKVISKISKALNEMGFEKLARRILNPKSPANYRRLKKAGLDDGVSI